MRTSSYRRQIESAWISQILPSSQRGVITSECLTGAEDAYSFDKPNSRVNQYLAVFQHCFRRTIRIFGMCRTLFRQGQLLKFSPAIMTVKQSSSIDGRCLDYSPDTLIRCCSHNVVARRNVDVVNGPRMRISGFQRVHSVRATIQLPGIGSSL
jgi:hypothetical protein